MIHLDDFYNNLSVEWNFYTIPKIRTRGLQLISQFYDYEGKLIKNESLELSYHGFFNLEVYL